MNEAPERIYSGPSVDDKGVFWDVGHWDKEPDEGCIEYVRADRIEELEAKLAKAVKGIRTARGFYQVTHIHAALDATLAELTGGKDE